MFNFYLLTYLLKAHVPVTVWQLYYDTLQGKKEIILKRNKELGFY